MIERGLASILLAIKVKSKRYVGKVVGKRFDREGPSEKVRQRRSTGEGSPEKVRGRRVAGEGLLKKVY